MSGWYLKSVSSEKTWTNAKTEWGDLGTSYGQYIYDLSGSIQPGSSDLTWRKIDTATDPSLNPLSAYWFKVVEAASSGSGDSGSGSGAPTPGWKKVFRQVGTYSWTSETEASALDNMKNNQLNTESDDNYSIMNEIFNSSTRDNYKYNGVYKFKMVNTEGYELTWTQTGNPFDHTDEAPGAVSDISAVNFTLNSGWAAFDGLHVSSAQNWTILDGVIGQATRYQIGQVQTDSVGKVISIPTNNDHIVYSDWVELYAYVSDTGSGDSGSGDSGSGSSTTTTYNFWDHGLSTDSASGTTADTNLTQWAAQFPIISSYDISHWNWQGQENFTTPGVRIHQTQQDLLDANYQNAVSLSHFPHGADTGFVEFTFTETASCKLVYGGNGFRYLTGTAENWGPAVVYKNGIQIDSTTDIQKILTFDVVSGDVIRVWEDTSVIYLYALEVTTL